MFSLSIFISTFLVAFIEVIDRAYFQILQNVENFDKFAQLIGDIFPQSSTFTSDSSFVSFDTFLFSITGKNENRVKREELLKIAKDQHDLISRAIKAFSELDNELLGEFFIFRSQNFPVFEF